ncbi:Protein of unknown function (DUF2464) [Nesidiocoris tenuis]|uniref:Multivesicular body subunit 12A n=1 Tax=Nesidiocoris tenuis TaxID=355587 RepID=A0ABN7BDR0_9HEMI|nr:Protein of unknown function (DUF2464) [Nesidiocoris tenuis]
MLQQIIKTLPDDQPITAICIVEDVANRPDGFYVVSKTHDLDSDADLWRGNSFFSGRSARYLCLSKTEGISDYIVDSIGVIGEKDIPPDGYCLISKTLDTDAKAWKKRQLCYSLTRRSLATMAVTDIILLSKCKKAPQGFKLAGDINGFAVCFKVNTDFSSSRSPAPAPALGYNLNPNGVPLPNRSPAVNGHRENGLYPPVPPNGPPANPASPNDEYVNLLMPKRRAPPPPPSPGQLSSPGVPYPEVQPPRPPPPQNVPGSYATLNLHQGLDGVPFVFHPTLKAFLDSSKSVHYPKIQLKSREEIEREFHYDFRLERESA